LDANLLLKRVSDRKTGGENTFNIWIPHQRLDSSDGIEEPFAFEKTSHHEEIIFEIERLESNDFSR
jgi:hypothetical protein